MSSANKYDVIGVGRAVYDYSVLVSSYPECDSKAEAQASFTGSGSPVPNALCQLGSWDIKTLLHANVGDDVEGSRFIDEVSSYSVDTSAVKILKGQRTPRAYIWVEQNSGKRTIVLDRDIAPLSPDSLPYDILSNCSVLLIDGWEADAAIEAARFVKAGKQNNNSINTCKVMFDAGNIRPRMEELLALSDWIVAPEAFLKAYYKGKSAEYAVADIISRGAEYAVITSGEKGCIAAWKSEVQHFPSYPAESVDTTGAGDVFHAGIIYGILKKLTVPDTIRWASAAAALSTTKLGGRGLLPGKNDVKLLINS